MNFAGHCASLRTETKCGVRVSWRAIHLSISDLGGLVSILSVDRECGSNKQIHRSHRVADQARKRISSHDKVWASV